MKIEVKNDKIKRIEFCCEAMSDLFCSDKATTTKNMHIYQAEAVLCLGNTERTTVSIRYCPNCGEKLKVEPWLYGSAGK